MSAGEARPVTRALTPDDAEAFLAIRREALAGEPLAFLSSPEDDVAATIEAARDRLGRAPDAAVFGAFASGLVGLVGLVGIVGVYREQKMKAAHRAHVWGMYVRPEHRGRGLGAALLQAAVDHARDLPGVMQLHLGATAAAPGARRLYERLGFRRWGTEPRYLSHDGRIVDCDQFVLDLCS